MPLNLSALLSSSSSLGLKFRSIDIQLFYAVLGYICNSNYTNWLKVIIIVRAIANVSRLACCRRSWNFNSFLLTVSWSLSLPAFLSGLIREPSLSCWEILEVSWVRGFVWCVGRRRADAHSCPCLACWDACLKAVECLNSLFLCIHFNSDRTIPLANEPSPTPA